MLPTLVLVIGSILGQEQIQAQGPIEIPDVEVWQAPATIGLPVIEAPLVSPWPDDLPAAVQTPNGTFFPLELEHVVVGRLIELETYPLRCQARINEAITVSSAIIESERKSCEADCLGDAVALEVPSQWKWWHFALVGAASLVVGAGAGAGIAFVAWGD